jgi:hypothetical protein
MRSSSSASHSIAPRGVNRRAASFRGFVSFQLDNETHRGLRVQPARNKKAKSPLTSTAGATIYAAHFSD